MQHKTLDPLTFQADYHTDLWIARRVMGWQEISEKDDPHDHFHLGGVIIGGDRPVVFRYGTILDTFQPSSDIEDALEVLRKMKAMGWNYVLEGSPKDTSTIVIFFKLEEDDYSATAESECLAVCRAAGLAVIGDGDEH